MLAASRELVRQYRHSQWDVEHIRLAVLRQEGGLAAEILGQLGVDPDRVRQRVEEALDKSPKIAYEGAHIYGTPRTAQILQNAPG